MHALPDLPYASDALAPHLSSESFDDHHGRHHAGYVAKLNDLLRDHVWAGLPLSALIVEAAANPEVRHARAIYNNAAQHWNHAQFWTGMKPKGGGVLPSELDKLVRANFGGLAKLRQQFMVAGVAHFGSGWVWLLESEERLEVVTTSNADNPLTTGKRVLIGCDLWEHAYYVDHRNARTAFLAAYLHALVNWEEVARRLSEPPL